MSTQSYPLDLPQTPAIPHTPAIRPARRSSAFILGKLMDEPVRRKTPALGNDTAWALKLKNCVETVARDLQVDVLSAKPMQSYAPIDSRDMLFEVNTNRGRLEVLRDRSGHHSYHWASEGARSA